MLTSLRLTNFGVVDEAALELGAGLTALTGETGAGKSILIDALQIVLGGRGDAGVVREGESRAEIAAEFEPVPPALAAWLDEVRSAARARVVEAQLGRSGKGYSGSIVLTLAAPR